MTVLKALEAFLQAFGSKKSIDWMQVFSDNIPTILTSIIAIVSVISSAMNSRKQMMITKTGEEIAKLQECLCSFYYPYLLLSKKNTALYSIFSKPHKDKNPGFRTLMEILSKAQF